MQRMMMIAMLAALSACQTKEVAEMNYSELRKLAMQKTAECASQGVKPGTDEMKLCVNVEMQREQAIRKNHNARRRSAANSDTYCQGFGSSVVCF